ncbi:MAG: 16S rRNA (cytidine(1402)-2'-O)-methyltransferase [Clostridia bacterium]|nr:16S rRNA (cytidine(1402)-2'-O)-methyltransferase [Clostridia bacterium]
MANEIEKGCLYLTGTPIGNLSDMSDRVKKVLAEVDFIAAEDTRVTGKLLQCIGVKQPMISYFEHNKHEKGEYIISRLKNGESCALVTDAGMPAISDPGEDLVRLCAENDITVYCVPGPSAVVSALAVSGLPTSRFTFEGFLSTNKKERTEHLESVKSLSHTLIFYEAPHKLCDTLAAMLEILGDRRISLVKELTKLNERVHRTTLSEAVSYYTENAPKGEFVLVVEGGSEKEAEHFWDSMSVTEHVDHYIAEGVEKMDAIKKTARDRGVGKSIIYKEYTNS